jgi:hypothetical protein
VAFTTIIIPNMYKVRINWDTFWVEINSLQIIIITKQECDFKKSIDKFPAIQETKTYL